MVLRWKSHLSYLSHFKRIKQVICMRRKMLFTISKYLFSFQRYYNMQISQVSEMTSYTQPNFDQIWWKKDFPANFYQKYLILCSKILLNVIHNMSFKVFCHGNILGSRPPSDIPFWYLLINGDPYGWSNKHINVLAQVCGLV